MGISFRGIGREVAVVVLGACAAALLATGGAQAAPDRPDAAAGIAVTVGAGGQAGSLTEGLLRPLDDRWT
ncbi:hypothetical protein ACGFX8_06075 [Streptomyces sp. NPDC048362]|uniref:hypothetical protein n=1 Tax=Streptomyces sp. NPDC048362 TaxID=3365539 RepID=UPI0037236AEE